MTTGQRLSAISVPLAVAVGIVMGFLPRNWIELRLGIDPDGGSGLLESLLISIPIAIAVGIAIFVFRSKHAAALRENLGSRSLPR
jgi:hypothetical protein